MTRAFNRLEWQLAGRYLRARRRESFISIIAIISFLGIMLGVATLIVVMAVMNGFRADLLDRILGVILGILVENVKPSALAEEIKHKQEETMKQKMKCWLGFKKYMMKTET